MVGEDGGDDPNLLPDHQAIGVRLSLLAGPDIRLLWEQDYSLTCASSLLH